MPRPFVSLMLPLTLTLGLCAQVTQAPTPPVARHARRGPAPARIKGLRRPLPATDQALVQEALWDLRTGMVVVVEDQAPQPLPRWPGKAGSFRLFGPFLKAPALPPGMDPTLVISGGNTIGQIFPLGWGY